MCMFGGCVKMCEFCGCDFLKSKRIQAKNVQKVCQNRLFTPNPMHKTLNSPSRLSLNSPIN